MLHYVRVSEINGNYRNVKARELQKSNLHNIML